VRAVVVGGAAGARAPETADRATARPVADTQPRRRRRHPPRVYWRDQARESLRRKPLGQRLAELTGSFLMAAIVSAVLGLVILVAGGRRLDASVDTWTFFTWLTVSSIAGAWIVLGLAKFWEGHEGDDILRRFVLLVAGLAVGVAAFAACDALLVRLSTNEMFNVLELPPHLIPRNLYAHDGSVGLTPFLAFFATLFLMIRWWRQVDPLRKTRFSLWATALCALVAMLIPWQIPWGFMLAITTSVAVQLSAPWMAASERARFRHDASEAWGGR